MSLEARITVYMIAWTGIVIWYLFDSILSRHRTMGLPLAFVLVLTLAHAGAWVHADPSYDHWQNLYLAKLGYTREEVMRGLETSLIGLAAFVAGTKLYDILTSGKRASKTQPTQVNLRALMLTSRLLILIGAGFMILTTVAPFLMRIIPGASALFDALRMLLAPGVCGLIYYFHVRGQAQNSLIAAVVGAIGPAALAVLGNAILGDTTFRALIIFSFYLVLTKPTMAATFRAMAILAVAAYAITIAGLGWLQVRNEIRRTVWSGQGFQARVEVILDGIQKIEVFNPDYQGHQEMIDSRLNQNFFIGQMMETLDHNPQMFEHGRTIRQAAFAWVPRVIWKNKPERGGSDMIDQFTGKETTGSVSFGTGPIFEFYINYGRWGVILGMLGYGALIRFLDRRAASFMRHGNMLVPLGAYAAALPLITPYNNLFFIVNTAVATIVVAFLVKFGARHVLRYPITPPRFRRPMPAGPVGAMGHRPPPMGR